MGQNSGQQFFFKNLASSTSRYYGQVLPYSISEKTNDPILRKFSDGQTDRQADRQMDKSDFIGHYPINVEHLKTSYFYSYTYEKMLFWYETL